MGPAGGGGMGGSGGSGGGAGGSSPVVCPGAPDMISIPVPRVPGYYCIDQHEVTNKQYIAWLDKNPDPMTPGLQPPACMDNASFIPSNGKPASDNHPVVYVDWCDAFVYCQENGKRLCGQIGGGDTNYGDFNNPSLDQWHRACTQAGAKKFPYGSSYDEGACNTGKAGGTTELVGMHPGCEGGYDGIFDMSGNVWEWEDACGIVNGVEECRRRGGSYSSDMANVTCAIGGNDSRLKTQGNIGFRCCRDPM
jgi:formylglycine-generating enzyme required for sulfatase activity